MIHVDKKWLRHAFDNAALEYDGVVSLQKKIGHELLGFLLPGRQMPSMILDVGCGTGFCIAELAKRDVNVQFIGLDIAVGMLRQAYRRVGTVADFVCADAEALPLPDNSVDLIISNLVLQWCPNLEGVFSGFQRILKPGGVLLFSSFGDRTLNELRDAWSQVDAFSHVNYFQKSEYLKKRMVDAGLVESVVDSKMYGIQYPSVLDLMRELKGIGAHNVTLGRCRGLTGKGRFKSMIAAYEAAMPNSEIYATYEVLFGTARKMNVVSGRFAQIHNVA